MAKAIERSQSNPRVLLIDFNRVKTPEEYEAMCSKNRKLWAARGRAAAMKMHLEGKAKYGPLYNFLGKKKKYPTPEEFALVVQEYFLSCYGPVFSKNGVQLYDKGEPVLHITKPMTMHGLAAYCGLSLSQIRRYIKLSKDGAIDHRYGLIVERAFQECEAYAAGRLFDMNGSRGAAFMLEKMFNWQTEKEREELKGLKQKHKQSAEEHALKMKIMGEEGDEDMVSEIVIRRASRSEG